MRQQSQNTNNWARLMSSLPQFSIDVVLSLKAMGLLKDCLDLEIDHVGLRLNDAKDVALLIEELNTIGRNISTADVNGRLIYIFQMRTPLAVNFWDTFGVEVPFPKPSHTYTDGFEHVEFVLPDAVNTMEGVRDSFCQTFPNVDLEWLRKHYEYKETEPVACGDQLPNPTIVLRDGDVGIKFHALPIQVVVGFDVNTG